MLWKTKFAAVSLLALSAVTAEAAPITGAFSMVGFDQERIMAGDDVIGLDFEDETTLAEESRFVVGSLTGDFVGRLSPGDSGDIIEQIIFSLPLDVPLWTVGGFSFVAHGFDPVIFEDLDPAAALTVQATGTLYHSDFDPTVALWTYTGQDANGSSSWSATALSSGELTGGEVPEPGILALLSGGLLAAGLWGRRRQTAV